jgi:hypothetical protein
LGENEEENNESRKAQSKKEAASGRGNEASLKMVEAYDPFSGDASCD